MAYDMQASIQEITRPKSGGRPSNPHVVSARSKNEPDYDLMRRQMLKPSPDRGPAAS